MFIGADMDEAAITKQLDTALLTPEEMTKYLDHHKGQVRVNNLRQLLEQYLSRIAAMFDFCSYIGICNCQNSSLGLTALSATQCRLTGASTCTNKPACASPETC